MKPTRRLVPALYFGLALVLGFLLAVGLTGCEPPEPTAHPLTGAAPAASSGVSASARRSPGTAGPNETATIRTSGRAAASDLEEAPAGFKTPGR